MRPKAGTRLLGYLADIILKSFHQLDLYEGSCGESWVVLTPVLDLVKLLGGAEAQLEWSAVVLLRFE